MSQSNKVCLPPWPFKLSVKCDPPPPLLSTHYAPTHTLSCNSHYNLHITKYFNLMSYCKQTSQISYTFITLGPLSIAICLQFVLNTPPTSVYLPTLWLYFLLLSNKDTMLTQIPIQHLPKHNNTHPPTFHLHS